MSLRSVVPSHCVILEEKKKKTCKGRLSNY